METRSKASIAHLIALSCGVGLPYTLICKRSSDPFLAHHGRQATFLTLGLFALAFVHTGLHLAMYGVHRMQIYMVETYGVEGMGWQMELLVILSWINWGAMAGEYLFAMVVAVKMYFAAKNGEKREYFFMKKKNVKKNQ